MARAADMRRGVEYALGVLAPARAGIRRPGPRPKTRAVPAVICSPGGADPDVAPADPGAIPSSE